MFYRPGQLLAGRSKLLCETVTQLGLDVKQVIATWPLGTQYGTKDVVTADEWADACGP